MKPLEAKDDAEECQEARKGGGGEDMRRGEGRGEDFWGYVKKWMRLLYTD